LSGLRQGELFRLKPQDITDKHIKVLSLVNDPTKGKKTRFVELNKRLIPIIKRRHNGKYLFTGNSRNEKLNGDYVTKTLKKFGQAAGLPHINFKMFRSTFGYWHLLAGSPLKWISQQLGHASIETTERHYAKYITSESSNWVNKVKL
jgi:integrase